MIINSPQKYWFPLIFMVMAAVNASGLSEFYRASRLSSSAADDYYLQNVGFSKKGAFAWETISGSTPRLFIQDLITDAPLPPGNFSTITLNKYIPMKSWGKQGYNGMKVHAVDIKRLETGESDLITSFRLVAVKGTREKELGRFTDQKIREVIQCGYVKSPFENRLAVIMLFIYENRTEFKVAGCLVF